MTFLACLPSIWPPYTEECVNSMAPSFRERVTIIDNTETNGGVAHSWNTVARRVVDEGHDWLVIVSAATRFGPSGGTDFVARLDANPDLWVVESGWPSRGHQWVGWHLLAWSRVNVLERVGFFDENYWPAYGEDADISWRVLTAMWDTEIVDVWGRFDVDAWVASAGHGAELAGVAIDHDALWAYHTTKWGGRSGKETYHRPFNDETLPLSFWPTPPDERARMHAGWAA